MITFSHIVLWGRSLRGLNHVFRPGSYKADIKMLAKFKLSLVILGKCLPSSFIQAAS